VKIADDQAYARLASERDLYRQDCSRLEAELRKVRHAATLQRYRDLTDQMRLAIKYQDRAAFESAAKERAGLGVSYVEAAEMEDAA
jgi:hypothetical protein